ncbi:hypothetical protein VP1G_09762 [Cytospora mali]|uniref:Uncharacterized protein n=1 Tax=Cytospora mali TaxID=578113 RepID=A0A194VF66_CYTMA|nr:hypothetical protein VP1G_09762 [Valsa mali var. pyri (nom. inval.)]
MEKDGSQGQPGAVQEEVRASRPPSSPTKGSQTPTTPNDSKALPSVPAELTSTSPKSLTNQSASQPQLWRRRSVKSDKTLAVAELKLTLSHGSTAASTQQADSPLAQDSPLSKPLPPVVRPQPDSPILKSPESNPGHIIRPSASNKSLPRDPPTEFKGNKKSKDDLDGFSQYAQEVENRIANGTYKASDLSPARTRTPEIRHPPTPDYAEDETRGVDVRANMSPASPVYPITPPNDGRPLSMIPEDFVKGSGSTRAGPPPTGPLPALPPRSSSRSSPSAPVTPRNSLPRYSAPAGRATPEATSSAAVHAYDSQAGGYLSPRHAQNISSAFAPSIEVSDDDDFSTIRPSSSSRHATSTATNGHNSNNGDYAAAEKEATNGVPASPGEPDYYPVLQNYGVYLPGDVIPAPPLKEIQLDCFSGHAVFVFSKNDDHPVGCMACKVEDKNARFTCSHCSARLCVRCRDALMVNGRDLRGWVEALMG